MAAKKDVVVTVGGDTKDLRREMKKGSESVMGFGKSSRAMLLKVAKSMAKLGAAAVAAGAAIIASLVKSGSQLVDQQAKLAKAMKTSTASIQTLQRVADMEGIPSLVGNMEALTRRLSRAANGTGPAVKALDQLNLSAEQLLAIDADKRLELIGQRMKELIDPTEQQAIAFDLFDASGAKIAETINDGGSAIRKARKDLIDLGKALNDVESKKVEDANDAMESFNDIVEIVQSRLAIEFAPALKFIGDQFGDLIKRNKGFKKEIRLGFDIAIKTAAFFADALDVARIGIKGLEVAAAGFAAVFNNVVSIAIKAVSKELKLFIQGGVKGLNFLIEQANKLPFADIGKIGKPNLDFIDAIIDAGPASTQRLLELRAEFEGLIKQFSDESSGDKIRAFLGTVVQASREAVDEVKKVVQVAAAAPTGGLPTLPEGALAQQQPSGDDPKSQSEIDANAKFQEILQARLEILRTFLASEKDLEIAAHQERQEELKFLADQGVVTDEERRRLQEELEKEHQKNLGEIRKKGLTDLEKFNAMSFKNQTSKVLGELVNMTNGVAKQNKTMFEINKQAATGQAIVDGITAVMKTMSQYPFPLSIAMAGAQAAANIAQISAIQSQTFGGGGAAPSLAGSTAAPPVSNVAGGDGPGQNVFINLQGDNFGRSNVEGLIDELNEAIKDGARLVVT